MIVGDVVVPISDQGRREMRSAPAYQCAIVASVKPFVIVSPDAVFSWHEASASQFNALTQASENVRALCDARFQRDMQYGTIAGFADVIATPIVRNAVTGQLEDAKGRVVGPSDLTLTLDALRRDCKRSAGSLEWLAHELIQKANATNDIEAWMRFSAEGFDKRSRRIEALQEALSIAINYLDQMLTPDAAKLSGKLNDILMEQIK